MGFTEIILFCRGWTNKNSAELQWLIVQQTEK